MSFCLYSKPSRLRRELMAILACFCRKWKNLMVFLVIGLTVYASYLLLFDRKDGHYDYVRVHRKNSYFTGATSNGVEDNINPTLTTKAKFRYRTANKVSRCPLLSLSTNKNDERDGDQTTPVLCKVPEQTEKHCVYTEKLFRTNSEESLCKERPVDLCKVKGESSGGDDVVSCQNNACSSSETFSLGVVSSLTGGLEWKHFAFIKKVEDELNRLLRSKSHLVPFCFIRCGHFWDAKAATQLFLLPPKTLKFKNKSLKQNSRKHSFNINLILLDSVSRPHFYRSLPRTVEMFRKINLETSIPATVLDFQLFHSVKARTFETLHALFSGELLQLNESFGGVEPNPVAVGADVIFGHFSKLGYQTLWQEDMCWKHEWGMVRDLRIHAPGLSREKRWKKLKYALQKSFIDHVGITHSSCEVYRKYGVLESFHYPPIFCYGGRHYHEYFLEYLVSFLKNVKRQTAARPLFSFSVLCTGHEGSGKRIKTLDQALEKFVENLIEDENTFTVVFSDHGNTYGQFSASVEGQFEAFQPHMFMIIPERIADTLGTDKLAALKANRKRLVTVQDLHYMLMTLTASEDSFKGSRSDSDTNIGLLKEISPNRTCEDLNLLSPSLCICDGWASKVPFKYFHYLVAEFALGQLNELIRLDQYRNKLQHNRNLSVDTEASKSCMRLKGYKFDNVRQTRQNRMLKVSMNLHVQSEVIFKVEVQGNSDENSSLDMKLLSYERLTMYGIYKSCADPNIELSLCICSFTTNSNNYFNQPDETLSSHQERTQPVHNPPLWQFDMEQFGVKTRWENKHENCLFVLNRDYSGGVILEAANSCRAISYDIELVLNYSNMQSSGPNPVKSSLQPGAMRFLVALVARNPSILWKWNYTLHYKWQTIPHNHNSN